MLFLSVQKRLSWLNAEQQVRILMLPLNIIFIDHIHYTIDIIAYLQLFWVALGDILAWLGTKGYEEDWRTDARMMEQ